MRDDDDEPCDEPSDPANNDATDIAESPEFIRLAILARRKDWNAARRALDHLESLDREKLNKPFYVSEMGIGTRISNSLGTMGIETSEQLLNCSRLKLRMVKGIGDGALSEIHEAILRCGYTPAWDIGDWAEASVEELRAIHTTNGEIKALQSMGCKTLGDVARLLLRGGGHSPSVRWRQIKATLAYLGLDYSKYAHGIKAKVRPSRPAKKR